MTSIAFLRVAFAVLCAVSMSGTSLTEGTPLLRRPHKLDDEDYGTRMLACNISKLMGANDIITAGQNIASTDYTASIILESNGNLVVKSWINDEVLCESGINLDYETQELWSQMQGDGNLVTWRRNPGSMTEVIWETGKVGISTNGEYFLGVDWCNGGAVAIYKGTEDNPINVLWSCNAGDMHSDPFVAGDFSQGRTSSDGKALISNGLSCRVVAKTGETVPYANGERSEVPFHDSPDGAGVIPKNDGGYYYMTNAEIIDAGEEWHKGGVGVVEFNPQGNVISYQKVANHLRKPCSGGTTPWNSWVSCEESEGGQVWQVDPLGRVEVTSLGALGFYEAFAWFYHDEQDQFYGYASRDHAEALLTRYTANEQGMDCYRAQDDADRWCTLTNGSLDYLVISGGEQGTFYWTTDYEFARTTTLEYRNAEGLIVKNGQLYFVSKIDRRLVVLDLKGETYYYASTSIGEFDNEPDQIAMLDDHDILYICEDGGLTSGLFGRTSSGNYFSLVSWIDDGNFENPLGEEPAGVTWSPDKRHMYFAYLHYGALYDCTRDDGLAFDDPFDIVYLPV